MKTFYIDFIRQILEQTFENEHIKNPNFVGGKNQLNLFSFYEQLVEHEEVDRYVETFNQLANQQNRMNLIANGILSAPENPTITNLNNHLIIPLSFICAFRITLEDRDLVLDTINNLISIHKGRKVDIAELDNGKLFMVGTLGNNVNGIPLIKVGDYIGDKTTTDLEESVNTFIVNKLTLLYPYFEWEDYGSRSKYLYFSDNGKLSVALYENGNWVKKEDDGTYDDIIFPPEHNSFTKYKVSLSFDALRCDTPSSLDGKEIITISFGGSATIVDNAVMLGNDLTKLAIQLWGIMENGSITALARQDYWLEPLELPSSNSADTQLNRLASNKFITNTHTDSLSLSMQYTFICEKENDLIYNWFKYARYGTQTNITPNITHNITPNIIYKIREIFVSWGSFMINDYKGKIVESIDIENTESDTLTITIPMQIQGENN